jgi:hypothetical protein
MAACGLIMRRGLRARWEALLAAHGNPWYDSEASKTECKTLVEECAAVGGANDRREIGTSLHTITALFDADRPPDYLTEETERDVTAYVHGRAAAHVDIVAGMIEQTVVLDGWQTAGTFDRLALVPGFDLPLIADLKTGANLDFGWGPIAVQLAAYSRADAIYRQGPAKDGSQDQRLPMPAVDQHRGLVFWLDAGAGALEMFLVDLDAGWEAFEHSMWTRGWHKTKVAVPLAEAKPPEDLTPLLEASMAAVTAPSRRDWLQQRIDAIGGHDQARADLAGGWPPNLPTLRSSTDHTPEQLDAIGRLLDGIERRHELPFAPPDPQEAAGRVLAMFPNATSNQARSNPA